MNKEKVVGILGGMGPFATVDFFKQILDLTPAQKDWEHLRLIIDNNVKIPSRTRAVLYNEESPVPQMIASINNLAKIGADFVVIPCNSAHYFYEQVSPFINIPWLNIIQIASQKVITMGKKRPLILGGYVTSSKRLYSGYLPAAVYPSAEENKVVEVVIEEIKLTSTLSKEAHVVFNDLLESKMQEIDCVLLACTELPIIYHKKMLCGIEVVNSTFEYAKAVVKYAKN